MQPVSRAPRKRRLVLKVFLGAALVVVAAVLAAYAWIHYAPRRVPEGQPPLATVASGKLDGLRERFNAGGGAIRVLAMLSPT